MITTLTDYNLTRSAVHPACFPPVYRQSLSWPLDGSYFVNEMLRIIIAVLFAVVGFLTIAGIFLFNGKHDPDVRLRKALKKWEERNLA